MIIGISGYIGSGKDTFAALFQLYQYRKRLTTGGGNFNNIPSQEEIDNWLSNTILQRETYSSWKVRKFAGVLKKMTCMMIGCTLDQLEDQNFKASVLPSQWDIKRVKDLTQLLRQYSYDKDAIDKEWNHEYGEVFSRTHPMTVREFMQKLGTEAIRDHVHPNAHVNATMMECDADPEGNYLIADTRFPNEGTAIKDRKGMVVRMDRFSEEPVFEEDLHPSETALKEWPFDATIQNNSNYLYLYRQVLKFAQKFDL